VAAEVSGQARIRIGVISDTHGLLRPEAVRALHGSEIIVHAGDVGGPGILDELGRIAPVVAVRGNNDREAWAAALPETLRMAPGGVPMVVVHDVHTLAAAAAAGARVVIAGHSHQPRRERRDGVLFFNPGSAGPRRFRLPIAVGLIEVEDGRVRTRIVHLGAAARGHGAA
jgi:hypothetical protein